MYLTLKVKIKDVSPQVWRRIVVSDDLTFLQLHNVLQVSFGWLGCHLFSYEVCGYQVEFDPLDEEDVELNVNETKLSELPLEAKMKFEYVYDFGDYWEHEIVIEQITDLGPQHPFCDAGKNNCPMEDCGGAGAHNQIVKDLKSGKMDKETKEWIGDYDPKDFDIDEANDILSDPDVLDDDYLSMS